MQRTARIPIEARTERAAFVDRDAPEIAEEQEAYCDWGDVWEVAKAEWFFGVGTKLGDLSKGAERYYPAASIHSNLFCDFSPEPFRESVYWKSFKATLGSRLEAHDSPVVELVFPTSVISFTTEEAFKALAGQWYRETRKLSSADQIVLHPAYQMIIGMGREALPFIFRELKKTRGHWIWALAMITREDPAQAGMKFKEAVDSWLKWGEDNGFI